MDKIRPLDFGRYLTDVLKDSLELRCKGTKISTLHQYISYGDKDFTDLIGSHDIILCAVDNYQFIDQLFKHSENLRKLAVAMDCTNMQVRVHSNFSSKPNMKSFNFTSNYVKAKAYTSSHVLALEDIRFPSSGVHCCYWSIEMLQVIFTANYDFVQAFLRAPLEFIQKLEHGDKVAQFSTLQALELIKAIYEKNYPMNFASIVKISANLLVVVLDKEGIFR